MEWIRFHFYSFTLLHLLKSISKIVEMLKISKLWKKRRIMFSLKKDRFLVSQRIRDIEGTLCIPSRRKEVESPVQTEQKKS